MTTMTVDLLDRLRTQLADASDYRIAQELGVTRATVSRWRVGKGTMSDANALRAAELLGENPAYVLAAVHTDRTDSPEARKVWRKLAASVGGKAAAVLAAVLLAGHSSPSAAVNDGYGNSFNQSYVKRLIRRLRKRIAKNLRPRSLQFALQHQ